MAIDIFERRKKLGLTLEAIANAVGVSKSTVKKWENGYIKNMKRDKILLLADILRVSPLDILLLPNSASDRKYTVLKSEKAASAYTDFIQKAFPKNDINNSIILKSDETVYLIALSDDSKTELLNSLHIFD